MVGVGVGLVFEGGGLLGVGGVGVFDFFAEVGDAFGEGGEEGLEGVAVLGGEFVGVGFEDLVGEELELGGEFGAGGVEGVELGLEADGFGAGAGEGGGGAEVVDGPCGGEGEG